jgi:hypothetical protein
MQQKECWRVVTVGARGIYCYQCFGAGGVGNYFSPRIRHDFCGSSVFGTINVYRYLAENLNFFK